MFDIGLIQAIQKLSSPVLGLVLSVVHAARQPLRACWCFLRVLGRRQAWGASDGHFPRIDVAQRPDQRVLMLPLRVPIWCGSCPTRGGPGFPSGHVQGTVTVWGYLALAFARRWLTWLAAALIVLMCISRLYLGLHFPADVLGGLVLGLVLVLFYHWVTLRHAAGKWQSGGASLAVFVPVLLYPLYQSSAAEQIIGFFIGFFTADLFACVAPFEPRVSPAASG